MDNFLTGKKHIHFIGIGGSGMYPLAQMLHHRGFFLTGSDNNMTDTLMAVKNMGIKVYLGHDGNNIEGSDLVIYSAAIMKDNPELVAAKANNIETYERSELLGLVTSFYKNAICVSGTHGKTTTTSMLTHIMLADNNDLSAVIGGKLSAIGGSGRVGRSDTMLCEACEFNNTFLKLYPNTSLILNIDEDHMDFFKTMDNLIHSFSAFISSTTDTVVYNGDDENSIRAVEGSSFTGKKYTFGWQDSNDFYPLNVEQVSDFQTDFTLMNNKIPIIDISIFVPGRHNVLNAVAACATAFASGCAISSLRDGLAQFHGTGRRFERLYNKNGILVVDDYAHHPAEIEVTLNTAKAMGYKRVIAIHQPFTFSRTANLLDDFARSLSIADKVILTPIMGSREVNTFGITSEMLADKIGFAKVIDTFESVTSYITKHLQEGDLVLTLGCGDVYKVAKMIVAEIERE